jgi:ketosteroid isomerase-like protein
MTEKKNVELIKKAYEAFLRKDYDLILENIEPRVEWEAAVGTGKKIPFGGIRHGVAEVKTYFTELEKVLFIKKYEIKEYIAENDKVVALGFYEAVVKETNKKLQTPFVAIFTIKNEKLVKYEQFVDTAALLLAFEVPMMIA